MLELTSPNTCRWRAGCGVRDRPGTAYDADPLTRQPAYAGQQTEEDGGSSPPDDLARPRQLLVARGVA